MSKPAPRWRPPRAEPPRRQRVPVRRTLPIQSRTVGRSTSPTHIQPFPAGRTSPCATAAKLSRAIWQQPGSRSDPAPTFSSRPSLPARRRRGAAPRQSRVAAGDPARPARPDDRWTRHAPRRGNPRRAQPVEKLHGVQLSVALPQAHPARSAGVRPPRGAAPGRTGARRRRDRSPRRRLRGDRVRPARHDTRRVGVRTGHTGPGRSFPAAGRRLQVHDAYVPDGTARSQYD